MKLVPALAGLCLGLAGAAHATAPTTAELQKRLEEQQKQIDALAEALETKSAATTAASKVHVGGYGEMHYTNLDNETTGSTLRELDFHRFVIYLGYDFTDDVRFISELEFEHAFLEATEVEVDDTNGDGDLDVEEVERTPGELELEQAYVEFDVGEHHAAKAGLFLVPVGILNETHEPTTFYGVERNPVENAIIPTTWREGGAALGGTFGESGVGYDVAVHTGLNVGDNFLVRNGRQNAARANANDLAYSARLRYTSRVLQAAVTGQYQNDVRQGQDPDRADALLLAAHAVAKLGPVELRALWARWDIEGAAAAALERDEQTGYYGEASWKVVETFGFFGRYNVWDNGGTAAETEARQANAGFNFWPVPNVVLKADVQWQSGAADNDGFNLGVGYRF